MDQRVLYGIGLGVIVVFIILVFLLRVTSASGDAILGTATGEGK